MNRLKMLRNLRRVVGGYRLSFFVAAGAINGQCGTVCGRGAVCRAGEKEG